MVLKIRFIVIFSLILVFFLALPFTVSAADDGDGWSVWDLLDGLKDLFVPSADYFDRAFTKIRDNFDSRFGSLISIVEYLSNIFKDLKAYRGSSGLFVIKFPSNHLFGGKSVDLMYGSEGLSNMVRMAFSGTIILFTAVFAIKRVNTMIKS